MKVKIAAVLGVLVAVLLPLAAHGGSSGQPQAAKYCIDKAPIYVLGIKVYPGGHYCIPGP